MRKYIVRSVKLYQEFIDVSDKLVKDYAKRMNSIMQPSFGTQVYFVDGDEEILIWDSEDQE